MRPRHRVTATPSLNLSAGNETTASLTFSLRRLNSAVTSASDTVIQSVSAPCSFSSDHAAPDLFLELARPDRRILHLQQLPVAMRCR